MNEIINFLIGLGFSIERTLRPIDDFLPGIAIDGMKFYINMDRLKQPGDLLHEAGHVAIVPSLFRDQIVGGDVMASIERASAPYMKSHSFIKNPETTEEDEICRGLIQCGEAEALAWSYAAAMAGGIDPALVFHAEGYDGEHESILIRMQLNSHFGINGLTAGGMTTVRSFPEMKRWLQI